MHIIWFFSWRQTSNCVWDGPRESANDKTCDTTILDGHSGYCQCADSTLRDKKGCTAATYSTCNAACIGTFVLAIFYQCIISLKNTYTIGYLLLVYFCFSLTDNLKESYKKAAKKVLIGDDFSDHHQCHSKVSAQRCIHGFVFL